MMSLAAMFAVIAYASPASAELKLGGDAAMRVRTEFNDSSTNGGDANGDENMVAQFRVRLKGSADLGGGYFFKTMISTEENRVAYDPTKPTATTPIGGGWFDTDDNYGGLELTHFYFGRMMQDSHWMLGRLPLNSVNNPIYDLAFFAVPSTVLGATAVDIPTATWMNDRSYGVNYGRKIGPGEVNATLVLTDNASGTETGAEGDGFFGDGYVLNLSYKMNVGDVSVEPQALVSLTDITNAALAYSEVSPNVFGANVTVPAGNAKIGLSGFYTACEDRNDVDYSGYLLRVKGEVGNFTAWVDYNETEDNKTKTDYDNLFVWAQYNIKVHESATGSFSLTPTVRYRSSGKEVGVTETDTEQLRAELYATVTF